jgi:hypothetical protein
LLRALAAFVTRSFAQIAGPALGPLLAIQVGMTARSTRWSLVFAALLSASAAAAAAGDSAPRINAVQAPAGTDAKTRADLSEALRRHVVEAHLEGSLKAYSISPSLVQLRRYVEEPKQAKLVCLIDLALNDEQGRVVASVQGNATTRGASQTATIDAAAQSAVSRLPGALQALSEQKNPAQVAAR